MRAVRRSRKPESSAQGLGGPERAGTALPEVQASVADAERKQLSWSQGEDEQVGATSLAILARYGWAALHGVQLTGSDAASISHVAIGPGGVVVVDEKDWTGTVTVHDGVLRHGGYRCERDIARLTTTCATVTALLAPEYRGAVTGVLCVTTRDLPPEPTGGVHVVGRLHLASLLVSLPPRLSPLDVADITRDLTRSLLGPSAAAVQAVPHGAYLPTSPLANEASEYFVPRPVPGSPHAPVAPAARTHAPVPTATARPAVRVASPWPGDELVTPPTPPISPERTAPCWPGDEGPSAARATPDIAPAWGELDENWTGSPASGPGPRAASPAGTVVPMVRPTTPGWPGIPGRPPATVGHQTATTRRFEPTSTSSLPSQVDRG